MNGRACSLVRASAVHLCTVPERGLGLAVCFLCCVMRLRTPYRAGCTARIYTGACALHFPRVHVRYGVRLGQPEQCTLYAYVCTYGGRHVQTERCTTRREYVYACVEQYMAWAAWAACVVYMSACACTYVLCLYHLHSILAWTAGAMHRFRKPAECTGMHRLCLDSRA